MTDNGLLLAAEVRAAAEERRRELERYAAEQQTHWEQERERAITTARANLARAIGEEHMELLDLRWTGEENRSYGGHVWAELRWRGHTVCIEPMTHAHIVLRDRSPSDYYLEDRVCNDPAQAWRGILLFLADLRNEQE